MNQSIRLSGQAATFCPPYWLRNPHIQSLLGSSALRRHSVLLNSRTLRQASKTQLFECSDGVRLEGKYAINSAPRGLVTLIHGWEGSSDSNYILSAATALFNAGFSVLRLNLRDHGDTHHLNTEPYTSTRMGEVVDAIYLAGKLDEQLPHYLCGFSLGGNIALRVVRHSQAGGELRLTRVIAICPVLEPNNTLRQLEKGLWLYHYYFVRKWKRSLRKKFQLFPELASPYTLLGLRSLRQLHLKFVPLFTEFATPEAYFAAYTISGSFLQDIRVPTRIIISADDPIIDINDLDQLQAAPQVELEISDYGGHCAFLRDGSFNSWIDQRLVELLKQADNSDRQGTPADTQGPDER